MEQRDIHSKIKKANIKITELAYYLNISRPSLYKYMEQFNDGDISSMPAETLSVLSMINDNNWNNKKDAIIFMMELKKMRNLALGNNALKQTINEELDSLSKSDLLKVLRYIERSIKNN